MNDNHILIISNHTLFAEAITHVLQNEGISVAGTVPTMQDALPMMLAHRPRAIVVDCEEPCQPDGEMVSMLLDNNIETQVVFLTLADNRMIVHHWQEVGHATPADLVSVLRGPSVGSVLQEVNA